MKLKPTRIAASGVESGQVTIHFKATRKPGFVCIAWLSRHLQWSKAWQLSQAQPEQSNIAHSVPVGDTNDTTIAKTLQNKIHLPAAGELDEHAFTLNRPARVRRTGRARPALAGHPAILNEY